MARRYNFIPQSVLDDEQSAQQSRDWADQQSRRIADDWARSNVPDPLAPLRSQNQYLQSPDEYLSLLPEASRPQLPEVARPSVASPTTGPLGRTEDIQSGKVRPAFRDISQFGHQTISQADAYAICGPAAAVRLASVYGNDIPIEAAQQAAREVGWTQGGGMNGVQNQKRLMDKLGIPTVLDLKPTEDKIIADAVTGNPVTVSTPNHYFTVSGYDPQSGRLYVGKSGTDLKGGSDWMTMDEIRSRGGGINGALFANNPSTQLESPATKIASTQGDSSLQGMARQAALNFGLDPDIFTRQLQQESGFNKDAVSPAGAWGIGQFMPGTAVGIAKQLGVSVDQLRKDAGLQIQGAAQHMSDLVNQYGGDIKLALAAYNAGPGNVQKYGGVPPFEETQSYVAKILGAGSTLPLPVSHAANVAERFAPGIAEPLRGIAEKSGEFILGTNEDVQRQIIENQNSPLLEQLQKSMIPGSSLDSIRAITKGAERAGIPTAKTTGTSIPTPLGNVDVGPAELIGFAAGMALPGGPGGKNPTLGRKAGEAVAKGVGAAFQRVARLNDEAIREIVDKGGRSPLATDFLYTVQRLYDGGSIRPTGRGVRLDDTRSATWLSEGGPVGGRSGRILAIDRSKLNPSQLETAPNGYPVYRGEIPSDAIMDLGDATTDATLLNRFKSAVELAGRRDVLSSDDADPRSPMHAAWQRAIEQPGNEHLIPPGMKGPYANRVGLPPEGSAQRYLTDSDIANAQVPFGRGGGALPPGGQPPAPPAPPPPPSGPGRLGGPPSPGGPGPGTLEGTFDMWERNRAARNPPLMERWKNRATLFGQEFERQISDRLVDLNRLGKNVEVAASTYLGRLPAAQQRVLDEFRPWYQTLGDNVASNGRSMVDNFNTFVKLQRDIEVALQNSPMVSEEGVAQHTARGLLRGTPVTGVGPSGLRSSSAGFTGAANAQTELGRLQDQLSPEEWAKILTADKIRQQALDRLLDDRYQSGLISAWGRQELLEKYPHYNPTIAMKNVDDMLAKSGGSKNINVLTNNLRKLMNDGIKTDTEEPSLSAIRHVMRGDIDIRRNNTMRTIIDTMDQQGLIGPKEIARLPGDRPGYLSWYENGQRLQAKIVPEAKGVERAVKAMDESTLNWFWRAGQLLNVPLRLGAVTLSPAFILMNMTADFITTYIRQGVGAAARIPGKHLRGAEKAFAPLFGRDIPPSEMERRYIRAGGGMSALSQATEHADIEKLIQQSGGLVMDTMPKWQKFMRDIATAGPLRRYGEAVEMGPRVATFEAELARTAPGRGTRALGTPGGAGFGPGSEAAAAMAGRRSTIDFARSGHALRLANTWALFLNARVQGTLQVGRTLRDNPGSRWRLASLAAPVIATYAWNSQFPEEYADIPDWEKRTHAIVILGPGEKDPQGGFKKVPRISIPLREWGAFAAPLAYAVEQFSKKEPRTFEQAVAEVAQGVPGLLGSMARGASPVSGETAESSIMGMMPAPLRTFPELATNNKFFSDSPIESARMENLPPSEKYTERTTGAGFLGSSIARAIGAKGISPVQMDFIIQENFAGLGRALTGERINPLDAILRTYAGQSDTNKYRQLDKQIENMREEIAQKTRQTPEYAGATRDRQLQMLRQDQLALEEALKERYGVSATTRDYGLPAKYRGVTDPAREKAIDQAISKYEAWLRDARLPRADRAGVPRPSRGEIALAARYNKEPMRNVSRTRILQQQRRSAESREQTIRSLAATR